MARFILVHGSNHGAWCWRDVVPLLAANGHVATALDLPSHGADKTPVESVTLEDYVTTTITAIEAADGPVILVGHSAAGVTIASVAERIPNRITQLIYLAAYAPKNGESIAFMRKRAKRQLVVHTIEYAQDRKSYTIDLTKASGIFYQDCSPETVAFALPRLSPQPIAPQAEPVKLGVNYDTVAKSYILCRDDHTIPPEEQENIIADWPEQDVYRLDCGHSAFFACPRELVDMIEEIIL